MVNAHRTIRQFTDQPLTATQIHDLIAAAQHTATSHYLQSFSIIHITDRELRGQIAAISKQAYVDANGELFIVIADQHRAASLPEPADFVAVGADAPNQALGSTDKFIQATSDGLLATQNLVATAEAAGLGTVILGSILNDPLRLIALLHLPTLTFPLCGVIVGHPDQTPQFKPRMPQSLMAFENTYQPPVDWQDSLAAYDEQVHHYYATRDTNRREESFRHLLANGAKMTPAKRGELYRALRQQGFLTEA
ncbi:nitroreductase family protein [Lacticaseibacillus sp. GG6-2]